MLSHDIAVVFGSIASSSREKIAPQQPSSQYGVVLWNLLPAELGFKLPVVLLFRSATLYHFMLPFAFHPTSLYALHLEILLLVKIVIFNLGSESGRAVVLTVPF